MHGLMPFLHARRPPHVSTTIIEEKTDGIEVTNTTRNESGGRDRFAPSSFFSLGVGSSVSGLLHYT